jgi:hypothetical protein
LAADFSVLPPAFTDAPDTGSPASATRNVMTRPFPAFFEEADN